MFSFAGYCMQFQPDSLLKKAQDFHSNNLLDSAAYWYEQAIKGMSQEHSLYKNTQYNLAEVFYSLGKYQEAAEHYNLCLQAMETTPETYAALRRIHSRLGYIYLYITVELKEALKELNAEKTVLSLSDSSDVSMGSRFRNAYNLASANRLLRHFNTGLNHAYATLAIAQEMPGDNRINLSFSYSIIANVLAGMEMYEEATTYYQRKIEISRQLYPANHINLANDYNNLGLTYYDAGDYEKAQSFLKMAMNILESTRENDRFLSNSYNHLGATYREAGELSTARTYFDKAQRISGGMPIQEALTYQNLAKLYEDQALYDSALVCYQKAMDQVIDEFEWTSITDNPSSEQLFTEPFYYSLLNSKAACWLKQYEHTKDEKALKNSYDAFQVMYELTEAYRNNYTLESSKLFFQNWNHRYHMDAMRTVYYRYMITKDENLMEEAWGLIEKNKSLLMLENLLSAERVDDLDVPDSLIRQQDEAAASIWNTQRDIRQCTKEGHCDEQQLMALRRQLEESEQKLTVSRMAIRQQYPNYYRIAHDKEVFKLVDAKLKIKPKQLIINYFSTDDAYFVISTNGKKHSFTKLLKDAQLEEHIKTILTEVSGQYLADKDINAGYHSYTKSAKYVFNKVLNPILEQYSARELVIIPDGLLALIPFDALITETPDKAEADYHSLNYLVKDYSIQYGYSATLWNKNRSFASLSADASLLAFGTGGLDNQRSLNRLTGTSKELNLLKQMPNARVIMGAKATEKAFKKESGNSNIIHLAMHNLNDRSNPLNSRLIFEDDENSTEDGALHLYELFGLKMNPSLVVLSACETGVSDWSKGEGPYHIGRGFLYHGNPAMVISLWKVRDQSAAALMKDFYETMRNGASSTEALRTAKLRFLDSADEITAHPSNWAAFVAIGQVKHENHQNLMLYLFSSILLLGTLTWLWRLNRTKAKSPVLIKHNRS